jgi:REP element-mobilizing transposase RayT
MSRRASRVLSAPDAARLLSAARVFTPDAVWLDGRCGAVTATADHVHPFISYRAHQIISQIVQWFRAMVQGYKFPASIPGIPAPQEAILGQTSMGEGVFRSHIWYHHGQMINEYINEQEGEAGRR